MSDAPPRWISAVAGALIPPSRREEVLGDLEERYRAADPRRARRQYLFDAVMLVPAVFWTERHRWHISASEPLRLRLSGGPGAVRAAVEAFQQETYCRLLFYGGMIALVAVPALWQTVSRDTWLGRLYCALIVVAQLFTVYQHYRRGAGETVPAGASLAALVAFHRRALERRRDFLRTLWYWKALPLGLPLLIAIALGRSGVVPPLVVASSFALALTAARGQASRIQQQIDELQRMPIADNG